MVGFRSLLAIWLDKREADNFGRRSSAQCRSVSSGRISRLSPHLDLERNNRGALSLDCSTKERLPRSLSLAEVILRLLVWTKMSLDRVPPIPRSRAKVCGRNACTKWLSSRTHPSLSFVTLLDPPPPPPPFFSLSIVCWLCRTVWTTRDRCPELFYNCKRRHRWVLGMETGTNGIAAGTVGGACGHWQVDPQKVARDVKLGLLKNHFRPAAADRKFSFPARQVGKKQLKFQCSWLEQNPWLVYSPRTNAGFCLPCSFCCWSPHGWWRPARASDPCQPCVASRRTWGVRWGRKGSQDWRCCTRTMVLNLTAIKFSTPLCERIEGFFCQSHSSKF